MHQVYLPITAVVSKFFSQGLFFNINLLIQKVIIKVTSIAYMIIFVRIEDSKSERSSQKTHAGVLNCSIHYEFYLYRDYILESFCFILIIVNMKTQNICAI